VPKALYRRRIAVAESPALVPVRIRQRDFARGVQSRDLLLGQRPSDGAEVLAKLHLGARADDQRRDRRSLQQPVQRNLGTLFPVSLTTSSMASMTR
jgi:hypothetical protein